MILMTLDLNKDSESKRGTFYEKLAERGWTKVTRTKLTTTFRRDDTSDPDVAGESIKAAATAAGFTHAHVDYALLAGAKHDYREY